MKRSIALAALAATSLWLAPASAEDKAAASEASDIAKQRAEALAADLEEALAMLKESSNFLASQDKFSFEAEISFDATQKTGQLLEFGGRRAVTVRRPDRARIEAHQRDGDRSTLFFDGKTISIDLPDEKAYVSVQKPGSLDQALDYLIDDLETPAPLADFLFSDFYSGIQIDKISYGLYVDDARLGEQDTHHLAFTSPGLDFQIWIGSGERPLPHRLVIEFKNGDGSPQFRAQLHGWNLDPKTPDSIFTYQPPAGAEPIPIKAAIAAARDDEEGR